MGTSMNLEQVRALAQMQADKPDSTRTALCDSGYGDLADQWRDDARAFETAAGETHPDSNGSQVPARTLRAYARMLVSWSRISQLRDQARGRLERLTQPG